MVGTSMSEDAIECTVRSLQWIYAIIIALSIGEAFKQCVPVPDADMEKCRIHWDRLPSLFSLLVLIVPFYQGMTQWFLRMYCADQILQPYGLWLLVDCTAFTVEAGLFFMLARSLPKSLWCRFNCTAAVLLCFDILWGAFAWEYRTSSISSWVIVNVCTVPVLVGVFLVFRKRAPRFGMLASLIVLLVLFARTVVDYWAGWRFYFPR
jgi:hypothetical protein